MNPESTISGFPDDFTIDNSDCIINNSLTFVNTDLENARKYVYTEYSLALINKLKFFPVDLTKYSSSTRKVLYDEIQTNFKLVLHCETACAIVDGILSYKDGNNNIKYITSWEKLIDSIESIGDYDSAVSHIIIIVIDKILMTSITYKLQSIYLKNELREMYDILHAFLPDDCK